MAGSGKGVEARLVLEKPQILQDIEDLHLLLSDAGNYWRIRKHFERMHEQYPDDPHYGELIKMVRFVYKVLNGLAKS